MYILCGFFIFVFTVLYVRSRFWVRQPVRHWWSLPRLHQRLGAPPLKYVDHANVQSFEGDAVPPETADKLLRYVKTQTNGVFYPNYEHVAVFFNGGFISIFGDPCQGCIVSRPVRMKVDGRIYSAFFHEIMASEVESVSRFLLSTHETNKLKHYPLSPTVFRSSTPLWYVVPTAKYEVRWIQTKLYVKLQHRGVFVVKANEGNLHEVLGLWNTSFEFQVTPTIYQLVSWVKANLASIYYVVKDNSIIGMFFFRKTLMVDHNRSVIDCCSAIVKSDETKVGAVFSTLLHRYRKTFPIVRLHMQSDVGLLPMPGWYKKTTEFVFVYGIGTSQCERSLVV